MRTSVDLNSNSLQTGAVIHSSQQSNLNKVRMKTIMSKMNGTQQLDDNSPTFKVTSSDLNSNSQLKEKNYDIQSNSVSANSIHA